MRQIGLSIKDIKSVLENGNYKEILEKRKKEIESEQMNFDMQLSKINYLLEEKNMSNEIVMKKLPECTVYYKEGVIDKYSDIATFILSSGKECLDINPNIKCITPEYCFVSYLDGEYKE